MIDSAHLKQTVSSQRLVEAEHIKVQPAKSASVNKAKIKTQASGNHNEKAKNINLILPIAMFFNLQLGEEGVV